MPLLTQRLNMYFLIYYRKEWPYPWLRYVTKPCSSLAEYIPAKYNHHHLYEETLT